MKSDASATDKDTELLREIPVSETLRQIRDVCWVLPEIRDSWRLG